MEAGKPASNRDTRNALVAHLCAYFTAVNQIFPVASLSVSGIGELGSRFSHILHTAQKLNISFRPSGLPKQGHRRPNVGERPQSHIMGYLYVFRLSDRCYD